MLIPKLKLEGLSGSTQNDEVQVPKLDHRNQYIENEDKNHQTEFENESIKTDSNLLNLSRFETVI